MKKLLLTFAILMTIVFCANAQRDSFFTWTDADNVTFRDSGNSIDFALPTAHGNEDDSNAPLGSGLLVMTALGAGYALRKRKENE